VTIIFTAFPVPPYLVNEHFEDRYFDVLDAVEEAKHIYFNGGNFIERLSLLQSGEPFIIGETGFGAGRILLSLLDFLDSSGLKNINIIYNSVELHPVTADRMAMILEGFREKVAAHIDPLVEAYSTLDITKPGFHQLILNRPFGTITLNLWVGEALEMVEALTVPCDAWFLDGHGPKKNPLMWRPELLTAIGEKTKTSGTCGTFTVAVAVTADLQNAGFKTEQFPGFGRKRAVLRGMKL
jgi:tRNA U34 5-methylaminomethyl-2-thiouridine-forming methyltransferase MnmC